jgi:antitoxin YefM
MGSDGFRNFYRGRPRVLPAGKERGTRRRWLRSCRKGRGIGGFDICTGKLYVHSEGISMPIETSYTDLRENLASYLDRIVDDREVVVVKRRGARDVAIIAADELAGLEETAHLLRSPANAKRLREALAESKRNDRKALQAKPAGVALKELRRSVGL